MACQAKASQRNLTRKIVIWARQFSVIAVVHGGRSPQAPIRRADLLEHDVTAMLCGGETMGPRSARRREGTRSQLQCSPAPSWCAAVRHTPRPQAMHQALQETRWVALCPLLCSRTASTAHLSAGTSSVIVCFLAMPLCINQFKMFMSLQSNLSINAAAPEDLLLRHEKWELGSSESANVR